MTALPSNLIQHHQPHLVIRASAGTGKTFQLSTRYLRLILEGREPARILATTFTRKAAGEVLGRVLSRLARGVESDERAHALASELQMPHLTRGDFERALENLARNLHRLTICTIDSFFGKLCQSFRHELKLPHPLRMIGSDSALATELKLRAVQAVLEQQRPDALLELLQRLHHDSNIRSVTDSVLRIVDELHKTYLDAPRGAPWSVIPFTEPVDAAAFEYACAQVERELPALPAALASNVRELVEYARAGDWDTFFGRKIPERIVEALGPVDAPNLPPATIEFNRKSLPPSLFNAFCTLVKLAQAHLLAIVARRTEASYDLLHAFDVQYAKLRDEHRVLLFSDLTYKLTDRFSHMEEGDLQDVFFRIDGQIDHILLDEFQDTSVQQWWILGPLSEEVTSNAPHQASPDRTFFCVGDTKQAIYSWRGGCAEIFDTIEKDLNLSAHAKASMSQSRRSSQVVLDVVNHVFKNLAAAPEFCDKGYLEAVVDWCAQFQLHTAFKEIPGFVELRVTAIADDRENDAPIPGDDEEEQSSPINGETAHLIQTAGYVAQLAKDHPGRTIGVLTRRGKSAAAIIDLLHRLGVEASGEGGVRITDDAAVNTVLSSILMADHPGEGTPRSRAATAFHVANSPLGALLGLSSTDPNEVDRVATALRRRLVDEGYGRVISDLAVGLANSGACDQSNLLRLSQLVELADAFEPDSTLRPGAFVDFVIGSEVETTRSAPVRVMTIHKAKGLEFDIVVLSDLDSRIFNSNIAADTHRESAILPIDAVFVGTNSDVRSFHSIMKKAHDDYEKQVITEAICVMYVAMTRAKHALHMLVRPLFNLDGRKRVKQLSMATLLRGMLAPDAENEPKSGGESIFLRGDKNWDHTKAPGRKTPPAAPAALPAWRDSARAARAGRSIPTASPSSLESEGHVTAADLLLPATGGARLRGSAVHGWFSLIEFLDDESAPLTREAMLACAAREVPDAPHDQIDLWILQFHEMLARPVVRAALARPAILATQKVQLWRERAFVVEIDGRLLRGVFDRVVIVQNADGSAASAHLLDYKTDTISPEKQAEIVRQYEPQVRAYVAAIMSMLALPRESVTSQLLFVGAGISVPMDSAR